MKEKPKMPGQMRAALVAVAAILTATACAARAEEPFYKGKRISLIINFAAGGPTDIEGRLFAKHLVKHIDGTPNLIVQNMDGAGGMIGSNYLAEVAPRDGTALGYFTGSAWRYVMTPDKYRVDFRSYQFVAYQPGVSIAFARTDIPPGLKDATDIVKTKDVIAGGLGPENSKDLLIRLGLDMLGVPHGYVTSYRGSAAARLALQQREINFYAESPPSYRALVEPTLVKSGVVIPIWYDPSYDGENFSASRQIDGLAIPAFHELYQKIKGTMPSGPLWDAYRTVITVNGAMQRLFVLPPGAPPAAVEALRKAVVKLNGDPAYQDETVKTIGFVPEWNSGPDVNGRVRQALSAQPEMRAFLADYIQKRKK
jgi:tripartite-type tricarboxylate transporter receptor subunit TctC